jgi:hypothetical protein
MTVIFAYENIEEGNCCQKQETMGSVRFWNDTEAEEYPYIDTSALYNRFDIVRMRPT